MTNDALRLTPWRETQGGRDVHVIRAGDVVTFEILGDSGPLNFELTRAEFLDGRFLVWDAVLQNFRALTEEETVSNPAHMDPATYRATVKAQAEKAGRQEVWGESDVDTRYLFSIIPVHMGDILKARAEKGDERAIRLLAIMEDK